MDSGGPPVPTPLVRLGRIATILGVVALVALLVFGLTTKAVDRSIDQALAEGRAEAAPGFDLDLLEPGQLPNALAKWLDQPIRDDRLGLGELRGIPVVLNFWASWCTPCREEAPVLERGWRRWGPRGVLFLGLNMQDLTDDAREFLAEFSVSYPTIRDPGKSVSLEYGLTGIPETFFIDASGRVVAHAIGVVTESSLDRGVAAARSGDVATTFSGGDVRPAR